MSRSLPLGYTDAAQVVELLCEERFGFVAGEVPEPPVRRVRLQQRAAGRTLGDTPAGRFFVQTHDRTAEAAVIRERYGSIAAFVVHHGYGPDRPVPAKR